MRKRLLSSFYLVAAIASSILLWSPWWSFGLGVWLIGYGILATDTLRAFKRGKWRTLHLPHPEATAVFMLAGIGALFQLPERSGVNWAIAAVMTSALLVLLSRPIVGVGQKLGVAIAKLPGAGIPRTWSRSLTVLNLLLISTPLIGMALVVSNIDGEYFLLMPAAGLIASVLVFKHAWYRRRVGLATIAKASELVEAYGPRFILYWAAEPGSRYQLDMWVPQLKRLKIPFVIIVRNPATFGEATNASRGVPVLEAKRLRDIERFIPTTVTTVFYVNNAANNVHMVRFSQFRHVQLLHGDSEKRTSYNPVVNMYDKIFVSGQAAIDRYEKNNVVIPRDKFEIVGRPQVKGLKVRSKPVTAGEHRTVLYAPTWRGDFSDTDHSSLMHFEVLLEELLRKKCRVVFRPHPYSRRQPQHASAIRRIQKRLALDRENTGNAHVFGDDAEETMSLYECFNESDLLITDVSSVVTDYLFTAKPFAIVVPDESALKRLAKQRAYRGAYLWQADSEDWRTALNAMLSQDPLRTKRLAARKYYLGDFPAKGYTLRFVDAARREITRKFEGATVGLPAIQRSDS